MAMLNREEIAERNGKPRSRRYRRCATGARTEPAATSILVSRDRKSTRLNSSHLVISYAVFCLKNAATPEISPLPQPAALPISASHEAGGTGAAQQVPVRSRPQPASWYQ